MDKVYYEIDWQNSPSTATSLGRTNLRKVDVALNTIDNRVVAMDTSKANQSTMNGVVQSITYNESTGVLTITKVNGTTTTIDTKLEKLAVNFVYNPETQQLDITLDDGTVQHVDMSALVTQYEFVDTDTVSFLVETDGNIKASIIPGSITGEYLQPDYLANIIVQANIATTQAGVATEAADDALGYKNESEAFKDEAKQYRDEAEGIVGVGIATDTVIGLVKGNGNVKVKSDGAMWADQYKDKATATGTSVQFTDADDAQISITAMGGTGSVTVAACGKNLFNKSEAYTHDKALASATGAESANTSSDISPYIKVNPTSAYSLSLASWTTVRVVCFYDINKVFISGIAGTSVYNFTTPSNAHYIRFNFSDTIIGSVQLETGEATTYEAYKGNQITIPDVTTAVYPLYLTSYKGITNVFTLSTGQPTFTAIAKSELWARDYWQDLISNWLKGKIINFMGDSLTLGAVPNGGGTVMKRPFPLIIGELLKCTTHNYGMSGNKISGTSGMCDRVLTMDPDADVNVIMGGSNDWYVNTTLGKITDTDKATIYGGLNTLCSNIVATYPDAINFFVLTTKLHYETDPNPNYPITYVNDAIIDVAKKYNFLVIDMYNDAVNLNPNISSLKTRWQEDGVHFNQAYAEGYFAPQLARYLLQRKSHFLDRNTAANDLGEYILSGDFAITGAVAWVNLTGIIENISSKSLSLNSNAITVLEDGLYELVFEAQSNNNYQGTFSCGIIKNGTSLCLDTNTYTTAVSYAQNRVRARRMVKLKKNDIITFQVLSSSDTIVNSYPAFSFIQIKKLN